MLAHNLKGELHAGTSLKTGAQNLVPIEKHLQDLPELAYVEPTFQQNRQTRGFIFSALLKNLSLLRRQLIAGIHLRLHAAFLLLGGRLGRGPRGRTGEKHKIILCLTKPSLGYLWTLITLVF